MVWQSVLIGIWKTLIIMSPNLLLVGSGAWGQKYISTLNNFLDIKLTIANRDNWKALINQKPDGVIVCTPPQSHIEIATYALEKVIPTMIEKPLAFSLQEAEMLRQYTAPILINHIHLFSNRYQYIKQSIASNDIIHIYSIGTGTNLPRDYSALWDYGPHDISMILNLIQQNPDDIQCKQYNNSFMITMKFGQVETVSLVGIANRKERVLTINTASFGSILYDERDLNILPLPLTNALQVFINAIHGKPDYRLGLDLSLKVMQVLEKCQACLDNSI